MTEIDENSRWVTRLAMRDADRVSSLRQVEMEIHANDAGALSSDVLEEATALWVEIFEIGGRFPVLEREAEARSALANGQSQTFVTAMDQDRVDGVVRALQDVALDNDSAMHDVATNAILTLESQITLATHGSARIWDEVAVAWTEPRPFVTRWRARSLVLQEMLRVLQLLDGLINRVGSLKASAESAQAETALATQEANDARTSLQQARAEAAQAALAAEFAGLAQREHWTSWALRAVTILVAAGAVAFGIYASTSESTWTETAAHLAVVTVLGGISAYAGKLASAHRGTGDWAKSVEVQLKTFEGFLSVLEDQSAKDRVYEEFSRRVLGAPPTNVSGGGDAGAMPTAQLLELANILAGARRSA